MLSLILREWRDGSVRTVTIEDPVTGGEPSVHTLSLYGPEIPPVNAQMVELSDY